MDLVDLMQRKIKQEPPRVVCLCGSTRFSEAFQQAALADRLLRKEIRWLEPEVRHGS